MVKRFIIFSLVSLISAHEHNYGARAALAQFGIEDCHPDVRPYLATLVTRNTLAEIKNKDRAPLRYCDLTFIKNRLKFANNSIYKHHMHKAYECARDLRFLPNELKKSYVENQKNYELDKFCLDEIKRIFNHNKIAASALLEAAYNK